MLKPKVYLAGPMAGLTIDEADKWRRELEVEQGHVFEFINPCRNKEQLREHGAMTQFGYDDAFMCSDQAVFARDTHDVHNADALLINFAGAQRISVGTVFEMGVAWERRIPIVSVIEPGNPYDHIFTRQASSVYVEDLTEGVMVLRSLFNILPKVA